MRNFILFITLLLGYFAFGQCSDPVITNFECGDASQTVSGNGINNVVNTFQSGINKSANIGEYTDDGTNGWDNLLIDFETEIDLSSNPFLSFKLYSPSSIQVLAKLEGGTADAEVWSDYSQENTWEEFNFDFSASVGGGNTKLVLFFNAAEETGSSTDIYYVDDVRFVSSLSLIEEGISELIIYPNPVNNILKIISNDIINSYELFDISGRLIFTENHLNKKKFEIDISNLDSDIYILNTYSETKHESFKILKN